LIIRKYQLINRLIFRKLYVNGTTYLNGDVETTGNLNLTTANKTLNFGSRVADYLIQLYGTNAYGFGINGGVLRYNSSENHVFYCNGTERMRLDVSGNLSTSSYMYAGGTTNGIRINGIDTGNTFYQDANLINGNAANIGFTLRGTNTFNFFSRSTVDGSYTNILSMNTSGISLFSQLIYNYLFNNTGNAHNSTSDFNSITHFGYRFIQGNTNGPSGIDNLYTQSYSWYIGIGNDYPASGANSYGAQFALARNTSYPVLSVRFKENNIWGGWTGITAERVRLKTDLWHNSTDGKNRFYFQPNGRTYFRGYGTPTLADNAFEFMNTAGTVILGINDNGNAFFANQITCKLNVAPANPHDFIGIAYDNPGAGNYTLYIIYGSFTGFHRYFTNDELFDENEIQLFKDTYEGRIVISTGKIATQIGEEIKYDKEGILIENAHSIFELSRKKKDKRVIGVIGDRRRKTDNEKRLIVNSVGEGAIWVCNSNGNIENGDYITSSDYLGYGEKQDEIYLCNYTVAKATMDCDFQFDSPLYNCFEFDDGLRIAFIAASYHCG